MLKPDVFWLMLRPAIRQGINMTLALAAAFLLDGAWLDALWVTLVVAAGLLAAWVVASVHYTLQLLEDAQEIILYQNDIMRDNRDALGMANMIIKGGGPDPRKGGR